MGITGIWNLPHELTDRIIDFLHDDVEALRSCSMTHPSWTPTTRYHLFMEISLRYRHWDSFASILKSSPYLGLYVKILHVFPALPHHITQFRSIAPRLGSVEVLNFVSDGCHLDLTSLSKIGPVRVLGVDIYHAFQTVAEFTEFLSVFPRLEELSLINTFGIPRSGTANDLIHLAGVLTSLPLQALKFAAPCEIFTKCLKLKPKLNLRSLKFTPSGLHHWPSFPSFLSLISTTLTELRLCITDEETYFDMEPVLEALKSCTNLERFDVTVNLITSALLEDITSSLRSPSLKTLLYTWNFVDRSSSSSINRIIRSVGSLAAFLGRHRFSTLESVIFNFETDLSCSDCVDIKHRIISICGDMNILVMNWTHDISSW